MKTDLLASLGIGLALVLVGCGAPDGSNTQDTATSSAADTTDAPPLRNQYVLYYGTRAMTEVILQDGAKYYVIDGVAVYSGTWSFDTAASKLTLTPAAGDPAPPDLSFDVVREDCDHGWFSSLVSAHTTASGPDRYTPYGISPDFIKQYCHPETAGTPPPPPPPTP